MANITETIQWEAAIREIATTDPVVGGPTGPANIQAQQLANRTAYLNDQITQMLAGGVGVATLDVNGNVVQPAGLGINQTWQDVSASRAFGVTYLHTQNKPIAISVSNGTTSTSTTAFGLQLYVNNILVGESGDYSVYLGYKTTLFAIIPPNSNYKLVSTAAVGTTGLNFWMELR